MKTADWIDNYNQSKLPELDTLISPSTQDSNLYASCDAAKDKKVLIFTIGFEVENEYLVVMRDCASSENHFFDVDGTNISDAFEVIASQIKRLRLTQ